ncbi:scopoletin glucosyltransferase-like [Phalaenopsis equestris]|uniref:scopoletin glucosyltransferase-like n=1 Tax=Phalaenopsis equestris TaxID=78828 RepID=UPI0009E40776|nr:scopoletin glucosyltransferase-like [Phalaenopsis equestris]
MGTEAKKLHMLFFPFMAQGHMPPMINMAKLFAAHGARITILTTPVNAANIRPTIDDSIHIHIIPFPSADFGLPDGCENDSLLINDDQRISFFRAVASLRHHFDASLQDLRPDCVVTSMFLPWTYHVASARGVPRLVFSGAGNFAACAFIAFHRCRHVLEDKVESFILPGLPHQIEMLRTQVVDVKKLAGTSFEFLLEMLNEALELEPKNYGTLSNSFYELEPEYADHYRKEVGRAWNVGPASLYKEADNKTSKDGEQPASADECLKWLDKKPAGSIVYMCFGSGSSFSAEQLREMALGLEAAGHPFVWVVKDEGHQWVPDGFEKRTQGTGLVIRGWAPQVLILNHAAVGGFVTHCGWNSTLEGISAGLPMVTWPLNADQFYNE